MILQKNLLAARYPSPLRIAKNRVERVAALALSRRVALSKDRDFALAEVNPSTMAFCSHKITLAERRFYFRCLQVPFFCMDAIKFLTLKSKPRPSLLFYEYAIYIRAFERMALEALYLFQNQQQIKNPSKKVNLKTMSENIVEWFSGSEEDLPHWQTRFQFWEGRFDEWRIACERSFKHYSNKLKRPKFKGSTYDEPALLGLLANFDGARFEITFPEILQKFSVNPNYSAVFELNKAKLKITPKSLELDTWLIEIWPAVLRYGWNYLDVSNAAYNKFWDENIADWTDKASRIENRCKRLNLKLSEQGREKIGRPPNTLDETETKAVQEKKPALLPTMFSLTEMIDSLGMLNKHWASGETLASFQPIS